MNIKFKDSEEYKSLMQDLKKESLKVKNENIHLTAQMKHLAKEHEEIGTAIKNTITTNYLYKDPDQLIALTDYYQANRDTYPDFESFLVNYLPQALKSL